MHKLGHNLEVSATAGFEERQLQAELPQRHELFDDRSLVTSIADASAGLLTTDVGDVE